MTLRSARPPLHDRIDTPFAHPLSFGLLPRLLVLTTLFAVELLLLSVWLDNGALAARGGVMGFVGQWGAWMVRGLVGFAAIFLTFAYVRGRAALAEVSAQVERAPVNYGCLAAHLLAMASFAELSWALYGEHPAALPAHLALLWLVAGAAGIGFGGCWLVPPRLWLRLVRQTGSLWISAAAAVTVACVAGNYIRFLWGPTTRLTFFLAKACLRPFVSGIIADPASMTLGTAKFSVQIAPECSGFEGVGLILAFAVFWLWFFRRECRFPQALLLIPAGVATIFLLNAARIAALILIGNAGAEQVALGGFHSQAGWIGFNAVALGFSLAATRVPWLMARERSGGGDREVSAANPTAAYLLPFMSILAVGMIGTAVSSDFEWLYPLRFVAAAGVLWGFRKSYRALDWSFSWFGIAIGAAVFAMWIGIDMVLKTTASDAMPHALAGSSEVVRVGWIAFRVLAAIATVPIAEELTFRGYLLRRMVSAEFEALPLSTYTWLGLGVSSLAFGLLHGHLWFAGTLAGLLYAWAMIRQGRIGEAVIAHATTNALLAGYVLIFHKWHLWL